MLYLQWEEMSIYKMNQSYNHIRMIDPYEFTKSQKKKNHLSQITRLLESVSHPSLSASTIFIPTLGDLIIYLEAFALILQSIKKAS